MVDASVQEIESYGDHESEGITRVIRGSRVKKIERIES